jgi:hypothetical protein
MVSRNMDGGARRPRSTHIVDVGVDEGVDLVLCGTQLLRVQIQAWVLGQRVEDGVEHA